MISNSVQLITSILLLRSCQIPILQTSLIDEILSNMHLMADLGFLLGRYNRVGQRYNITAGHEIASLLILAVTSLIIPTIAVRLTSTTRTATLHQSRVTSVLLLFTCMAFLFFSLKTHASLFNMPSPRTQKRARMKEALLAVEEELGEKKDASVEERRPMSLEEPFQKQNEAEKEVEE